MFQTTKSRSDQPDAVRVTRGNAKQSLFLITLWSAWRIQIQTCRCNKHAKCVHNLCVCRDGEERWTSWREFQSCFQSVPGSAVILSNEHVWQRPLLCQRRPQPQPQKGQQLLIRRSGWILVGRMRNKQHETAIFILIRWSLCQSTWNCFRGEAAKPNALGPSGFSWRRGQNPSIDRCCMMLHHILVALVHWCWILKIDKI